MKTLFLDKLPMTLERSDFSYVLDFFFTENKLTIDDDMLTYNTRSTTYINYEK